MKMTHAILVFAGIVLVSIIVLGDAYKKRNRRQGSITVTGLSEKTLPLILLYGRVDFRPTTTICNRHLRF